MDMTALSRALADLDLTAALYDVMPAANRPTKPVGEWNRYRITCKDGTVKLEVNGQLVNEGRHAEKTKGKILLQSEGAEVHFRNIKLTPIAAGK